MSRLRRGVLVALAVAIAMSAVGAYLVRDPSPVGYWRSVTSRDAYLQHYRRAFGDLPAPSETRDVRIDYGVVRVYRFGSPREGRAPLVLVPGRSSGVPMWSENLPGLIADNEVYAIDALGDAGMSIQERPIENAADQAAWLDQMLSAMDLARVTLAGHSFGGWTAANYAAWHPDRVAALALWEPILVFADLRWQMYVATLPSALPFLPDSWRRKGLSSIGGGDDADTTDSAIGALIDAAASGFRAKLPTPARLSGAELAKLTMPVFVGLGARSAVTDAEAAARAARTLPNGTVQIWPDGTHSLPMQYPDELNQAVSQLYR